MKNKIERERKRDRETERDRETDRQRERASAILSSWILRQGHT